MTTSHSRPLESEIKPEHTDQSQRSDRMHSTCASLRMESLLKRLVVFDLAKKAYCLCVPVKPSQEVILRSPEVPMWSSVTQEAPTCGLFRSTKTDSDSLGTTSRSTPTVSNTTNPASKLSVIDIALDRKGLLAILLRDSHVATESVLLYALPEFSAGSVDASPIEPKQMLTHPLQRACKSIEWSSNDANVLAVGCADGVLVWCTEMSLPRDAQERTDVASRGICTFHAFKRGYAVDVIGFSKAHNGFFACSAESCGKTSIYSLSEAPSQSCIATLTTNRGPVTQVVWSDGDCYVAVRYSNSSSIDIYHTSDWSSRHWLFPKESVEYITWFTENCTPKLLAVTNTTVSILNFAEMCGALEKSVTIQDANFADSMHVDFYPALHTLVAVNDSSIWTHSLFLEHSEETKHLEPSTQVKPKKGQHENCARSIVFVDQRDQLYIIRPTLEM